MQLDISIRCAGMADCFGKVHLRALIVVGAGHSCKVYAIFHYYIFFSAALTVMNGSSAQEHFFCLVGSCPLQVLKTGDFAGESHDGAQIGAINFFNKLGERHKNKPGEFQYETREKKKCIRRRKHEETQRTENNQTFQEKQIVRRHACRVTKLKKTDVYQKKWIFFGDSNTTSGPLT